YLGSGDGTFTMPFDLPDGIRYVGNHEVDQTTPALGDMNGDGKLDLILGHSSQPSQIFLSPLARRMRLPNSPPTITISRPGPTGNANFYSTPAILGDRNIPIQYRLTDLEGDPVSAIRAFYSVDGGGIWQLAVAASGTVTTSL